MHTDDEDININGLVVVVVDVKADTPPKILSLHDDNDDDDDDDANVSNNNIKYDKPNTNPATSSKFLLYFVWFLVFVLLWRIIIISSSMNTVVG